MICAERLLTHLDLWGWPYNEIMGQSVISSKPQIGRAEMTETHLAVKTGMRSSLLLSLTSCQSFVDLSTS